MGLQGQEAILTGSEGGTKLYPTHICMSHDTSKSPSRIPAPASKGSETIGLVQENINFERAPHLCLTSTCTISQKQHLPRQLKFRTVNCIDLTGRLLTATLTPMSRYRFVQMVHAASFGCGTFNYYLLRRAATVASWILCHSPWPPLCLWSLEVTSGPLDRHTTY